MPTEAESYRALRRMTRAVRGQLPVHCARRMEHACARIGNMGHNSRKLQPLSQKPAAASLRNAERYHAARAAGLYFLTRPLYLLFRKPRIVPPKRLCPLPFLDSRYFSRPPFAFRSGAVLWCCVSSPIFNRKKGVRRRNGPDRARLSCRFHNICSFPKILCTKFTP